MIKIRKKYIKQDYGIDDFRLDCQRLDTIFDQLKNRILEIQKTNKLEIFETIQDILLLTDDNGFKIEFKTPFYSVYDSMSFDEMLSLEDTEKFDQHIEFLVFILWGVKE